jgi:predicted HD superfamily hydrolase involved in NAD metabolism
MDYIAEIQEKLESSLKPKRFIHSVNVMNVAVELAGKYGVDKDEAALAGLLHDCARDCSKEELLSYCNQYCIISDEVLMLQPMLLHGRVGAFLARDIYCATSQRVLEAISSHTMGSPGMDLLACIVFLADYIEPSRKFPGVEAIREEAFKDLKKAMLIGIDGTITSIIEKGCLLHPDTVATRNWLIKSSRYAT